MSIQKYPAKSYSSPEIGLVDFIPVKVRSLFPGSALPCDFYFPAIFEEEIRLDMIMTRGEVYLEGNYCSFLEAETDIVYIKSSDEREFLAYLMNKTQEAVKSQETPNNRKTLLLYDSAEAVVKKICREHPDESSISAGKRIIEDFAAHIAAGETTVTALLSIFSKDYYTFSHCVQVATLGMSFGNFLGWSKSEISEFGFGALFHDLGKNSISDSILNKPGKLEKHEFEIIKQHPFTGYQQLKRTKAFSKDQLDTILYHHEAMDGSGYPDGLSGNEIPLCARAAHVVDVFDALTSARVYKGALSRQDTLGLMRNEMRSSFDAALLGAFTRYIEGGDSHTDACDDELKAGIGTFASIQCETSDKKAKSILIGMEAKDFLILKLSDPAQAQTFPAGTRVIIRYVYAGEAYGFKGKILELVQNPLPLVLVTYPGRVEKLSLRCERRQECFLPAKIEVRDKTIRCVTVNLSYRGCRVFIKRQETDQFPSVLKDEPIVVFTGLPGREEPVCLRGQVKNKEETEDGNSVGIQFAVLSEQAADHWKAFIDDILELTR